MRVMPNLEIGIMNHGQIQAVTGFADAKLFSVEERPVIDRSACVKKRAAENNEGAMRSIDPAAPLHRRGRSPLPCTMPQDTHLRREPLFKPHQIVIQKPKLDPLLFQLEGRRSKKGFASTPVRRAMTAGARTATVDGS